MIQAHAKLNIFLEITGKNGQNHNLHSLFVKINLFDEIQVEKCSQLAVVYSGASIENDIILKAVRILKEHLPKINTNFKFTIKKNIPIGGGLGGASSNAAQVVKFLLKGSNIMLSQEMLFEIASKIGADVPFFLCEGPMILNGVGKELSMPAFQVPKLWFVLTFPNYCSITKEVFANITPPYTNYSNVLTFEDCILRKNDMQNAASKLSGGLIVNALKSLEDKNALCVKMSGSGSTCFAMFLEEKHVEKYRNLKQFTICKNF